MRSGSTGRGHWGRGRGGGGGTKGLGPGGSDGQEAPSWGCTGPALRLCGDGLPFGPHAPSQFRVLKALIVAGIIPDARLAGSTPLGGQGPSQTGLLCSVGRPPFQRPPSSPSPWREASKGHHQAWPGRLVQAALPQPGQPWSLGHQTLSGGGSFCVNSSARRTGRGGLPQGRAPWTEALPGFVQGMNGGGRERVSDHVPHSPPKTERAPRQVQGRAPRACRPVGPLPCLPVLGGAAHGPQCPGSGRGPLARPPRALQAGAARCFAPTQQERAGRRPPCPPSGSKSRRRGGAGWAGARPAGGKQGAAVPGRGRRRKFRPGFLRGRGCGAGGDGVGGHRPARRVRGGVAGKAWGRQRLSPRSGPSPPRPGPGAPSPTPGAAVMRRG